MELNKGPSFIGLNSDFQKANIVVFGAPFDGTTSFRPGTRFAPNIIRLDSDGIETYSPYLDMDLEDYEIHDAGDLEFPFGNTTLVMESIERYALRLLEAGKCPVMIGGEHLVSYPAIKAVSSYYEDLVVLHFDAHTDLREDYMGQQLSHATVMKRVWDLLGDERIFQFGIRSGTREEFKWSEEHTTLEKFRCDTLDEVVKEIGSRSVYITIDLDILDPSIFGGTGTPEAGGISFVDLMKVIKLIEQLNIVGADMVELSPHYDQSGVSTAVACKVLREMLLAIHHH